MNTPPAAPPRVYQNHHLDSTRWQQIAPRDGDVIITTSYKSGTTWTQQIVNHLVNDGADPMPTIDENSPWIDAVFRGPIAPIAEACEAIQGRRFFKSHLPCDGLPYWPEVKYVVVARDARDVFMSLLNHYGNYTEFAFKAFNNPATLVGDPMPPCPDDPRELWRNWITRGWFEWESEGWPFWSNLHHTGSFWPYRQLPNVMFLHYNDMLADLDASVRRLAAFCDIEIDDGLVSRVVHATTFSNMKKGAIDAEKKAGSDIPEIFHGGQATFINKGTNGRWRDVLTDDDLQLYEEAKQRVLEPECARWLEEGGAVT